jgi:hypothetical protein
VSRLLETIFDSGLTNAIRPPPLDEQVIAFPRHTGTERYLHRNDPFLTSEVAATLIKLAGAIGCLLSGTIAFYSLLRLRNLKRFEYYYREIWQIEMNSRGLEKDSNAPTDATSLRAHLEERLTTLKCQALQDFAAGGMKGEALMAGIIALINDTRGSLARTVTVQNNTQESEALKEAELTKSISCATNSAK